VVVEVVAEHLTILILDLGLIILKVDLAVKKIMQTVGVELQE
jgi:hypothetical protein